MPALAAFQRSRGDAECLSTWEECSQGGSSECTFNLGMAYLHGEAAVGVAVDKTKAWMYLENAAKQAHGSVAALVELGKFYERGEPGVVARDPRMAIAKYYQAAQYGASEAQYRAGKAILNFAGKLRSAKRSKKDRKKLPSSKIAEAPIKKALALLEAAYEQGSVDAALELGSVWQYGQDVVKPDEDKAYRYVETAAKAGNAEGMYQFATFLANDVGPMEIDDEAVSMGFMERAAGMGHGMATHNFASLLMQKEDDGRVQRTPGQIHADQMRAISLYRRAAQTVPESAYTMGVLYSNGQRDLEIPEDKAVSAEYFATGAIRGDAKCQKALMDLAERKVPEALWLMSNLLQKDGIPRLDRNDEESMRMLIEAGKLKHERAIEKLKTYRDMLEAQGKGRKKKKKDGQEGEL
eukprot:TRINITY_DN2136_c0_g1_i1.p1 TRINITY_DN2136_c0_g1~~TRINITY_DN2136_c0_g1_i1.p1  ORF type:complete len:422 (+),score=148.10 TRINITY_DN2136_c0_g1_i1:41-1267(+)